MAQKNIIKSNHDNLVNCYNIHDDESLYEFFDSGYSYSFNCVIIDFYLFDKKNINIDNRLIDIIIGFFRYPVNYEYLIKKLKNDTALFEEKINNRNFIKYIIKISLEKHKQIGKFIKILLDQFIHDKIDTPSKTPDSLL